MGSCFSSSFKPNDKIKGQSKAVIGMCRELGLTQSDLNELWRYFKKADVTGDGSLNVGELCLQHEIQNDSFGKLLFGLLDYDKSGSITFEEFCLCIWNAMTLDDSLLPIFAFRIYDHDNSGTLNKAEVLKMLNIVCGNNEQSIQNATKYFKENDRDHDGKISAEEFCHMTRNTQLILFPAFQLRDGFRKNVLGERSWHEKTNIRNAKFKDMHLSDIINKLEVKPESYRGHLTSTAQKITCTPISPASNSVDLFPHVPSTDALSDPSSKRGRKGSVGASADPSSNQDQKPSHYHADAHPPHIHRTTDHSSKPRKNSKVVLDAQQMMHEDVIAGQSSVRENRASREKRPSRDRRPSTEKQPVAVIGIHDMAHQKHAHHMQHDQHVHQSHR